MRGPPYPFASVSVARALARPHAAPMSSTAARAVSPVAAPPPLTRRLRPAWCTGGAAAAAFSQARRCPPPSRSHARAALARGGLPAVPRRNVLSTMLSTSTVLLLGPSQTASAETTGGVFREYIDIFDGYTFLYPKSWIQVRGAGADIFFRDPLVLDENMSVEISSPSSSKYTSVEDLGPPEKAAEKVLKQYLTEFMSTRLGVRRESNILSASSKVADDGRLYYEVEVNIKSYASNNELAVMPQDRVQSLEWDRRYLSVLGVENKRLYELRLQTPEQVFVEEEDDLRRVMDSFRVIKTA
ncbi:hypothetical protein BS78_08G106700 [Paspalum vaginatum]|nr:hypothetical protein BS78_08G106700 [Paspalum vaginatum]